MTEDDFSELYNFLFQRPEEAVGPNEGRFVPSVSGKIQQTHPMFGVVAMSMALYTEEESYNMALLRLIRLARLVAEHVSKSITIDMVEYVLDEKDR